jgi:hypothetical protein
LGLSFVPYVGVLVFTRGLVERPLRTLVPVLSAFSLGAIWLFAPPVLSDDAYRYVWEGRLWLEGFNPYRMAPDDPALAHLRDGLWESINNKPLASIYPPLSQLLFVVAAWLGGGVMTVKWLALGGLVLTTALIGRLTGDSRAALAVGLNPLLSAESALNGHFDVLVGAALLGAAWALSRKRWTRAAVAVCTAVGLKVVGLVALPSFWRRRSALIGASLVSALLVAPLVVSRMIDDPASGPGQFATRWQGNESLFALVDWLSHGLLPDPLAGSASRVLVVVALAVAAAVVVRRRVAPTAAIRGLLWAVLLLSPQVHPWYLAWLLPLEIAAGGRAGVVWSAAVLLAYAPLDRWVVDRVWDMPVGLQVAEYLIVAAALLIDLMSNSKDLG